MIRVRRLTSHVEAALERVRAKHPTCGDALAADDHSRLAHLREILAATPPSDLARLAKTFHATDLSACVTIVSLDRDETIRSKAAAVVSHRPRSALLRHAWLSLLRYCPHRTLEGLVRSLLENLGEDVFIARCRGTKGAVEWLGHESVVEGLFRVFTRQATALKLDAYLFLHGLDKSQGMYSSAWDFLMSSGDIDHFVREGGDRILLELLAATQQGERLARYCTRYLNIMAESGHLYTPILELILRRFGRPADGDTARHEDSFWTSVSDTGRAAFMQWLMKREISEFFSDDERSAFWASYVDNSSLRRVKRLQHVDGFLLDFGAFGVIEFKEIGNAAYVYAKEAFAAYWDRAYLMQRHTDFKDKTLTLRTWPNDGRIFHHTGWEERTSQTLRRHGIQ